MKTPKLNIRKRDGIYRLKNYQNGKNIRKNPGTK